MKKRKPHIIIIMADQLRYDVLNQGYTPHIDGIREDGICFNRAYTNCPLCVPARAAFFTGTYPNKNGSLINPWEPADKAYGDVKEGIDNLYTLLENDWDSLHSGKQHLFTAGQKLEDRPESKTCWLSTEKSYQEYLQSFGQAAPGGPGFRTKVAELVGGRVTRVSSYSNAETGCYQAGGDFYFDTYFARQAVAGLKKRSRTRPLLLNAMFLAPHPPFQIPRPWYERVKKESVRLPENVGVYYPHQSPLQMYNLTGVIGTRYSREQWEEIWRVYLGLVSMLDECVGQIIAELKSQGIYEDSLIIFTSDHGEMLGSHALFQKMCMYEEAARVPLYIKFPQSLGLSRGECQQIVSHIDVLPTICDYLGIPVRQQMDGESLLPLLQGEKKQEEAAFIQYDGNGSRSNFQRCIVEDAYKLIVSYFKDEIYYELYNVTADTQEKDNLMFCPDYDDIAVSMADRLRKHMKDTGDLLSLPHLYPADFRILYSHLPTL